MTYKHVDRPTASQAFEHEWLRVADDVGRIAHKEVIVDSLVSQPSAVLSRAKILFCETLITDRILNLSINRTIF